MASNAKLVGIVNITPDSFSDSGESTDRNDILDKVSNLISSGANVIDIGAESTRPGATPLTAEQEWERLEPILTDIISLAKKEKIITSIDTRHPDTAQKAINLGVDWLNDVSGLENSAMIDVLKNSKASIVLMHNLGIPADKNITLPQGKDPVKTITQWAESKIAILQKHGIDKDRIIFDPGIGFGKTAEQSLALLKNIDQLHKLGVQILVGHSRKSFLETITQKTANNRDLETLAASTYLNGKNVQYLRVHNVEMHNNAFKVLEEIEGT